MCWVALDRAVVLAPMLGDEADVDRWAQTQDEIRDSVLREGWNEELGAFAGALGSDQLDASVLLLPLVGFLPADVQLRLNGSSAQGAPSSGDRGASAIRSEQQAWTRRRHASRSRSASSIPRWKVG